MKEFNELDELFKEGLQNAQFTPPPGVWESIASSAAASATSTAGATVWLVTAKWIAGGLAAAAITWFGYQAVQNSKNNKAEVNPAQTQQTEAQKAAGEAAAEPSNANRGSDATPVIPFNPGNSELTSPGAGFNDGGIAENSNPIRIQAEPENTTPLPASPASPTVSKPNSPATPVQEPKAETDKTFKKCPDLLSIQTTKLADNSYSLLALNAGGTVYWDVNDGQGYHQSGDNIIYRIPAQSTHDIKIKAMVTYESHCKDSAQTIITIEKPVPGQPEIYDVFTPNGDGYNDTYLPLFSAAPAYFDMTIYDLNNRQLFHSDNYLVGWNGTVSGTVCNSGRYILVLVYRLSANGKPKTVKKNIELIR